MLFKRSIYTQILYFAVFFISTPTLAVDLNTERMIDSLANLQFDKLSSPQIKTDSIKPVLASLERPHRLLVIAVEFPELGYDRFAGDKKQNNKNRNYLQKLLFGGSIKRPKPGTLSHYYRHQSKGLYNITGQVMPIAKVSKPLAYYGRPLQNADGSWRNDDHTDELVIEALQAAHRDNPNFPWKDYDIWDPKDFDGDGNRAEADGYLDHLVIVYAGKAQSSCQGLYKLNEKFTVNAESNVFDSLPADEQDCADRIWPHRSSLNRGLGKGPVLEGLVNGRGGHEIEEGLWLYDYNMQSEYTEVSTFIHEFGHSLGLPDIYARATNNSSASWEVMSSTASPEPQELSAWSRMVLGWLNPCVVRPPAFGGNKRSSMYLKTMNDWSNKVGSENSRGVCDATMIILPPKIRELQLGPLSETQGNYAIYTAQGNDLHHFLSRSFDLREVAAEQQLILSFDTWFKIESDWDYLYIEVSTDGGEYQRLLPTDKDNAADTNSTMPSKKGHEGEGSLPGFSGRSGDMDGDGKVEIAAGCDPSASKVLAEDRVGENLEDACETAQWIAAKFDLEAYRGKQVTIRLHYFADGAAVEDGALIDNIRLDALSYNEDFESGAIKGWSNDGFTLSGGEHRIAVPHYYLLEYRDPYASFDRVKNYDAGLAKPGFSFFKDSDGEMKAFNANYRPGVLAWYYNGEYLWSQNEPAQFGPGNGFLLLVDANPQEFNLPSVPKQYFVDDQGWTSYQFDESAQPWLQQSYVDVMCHQRRSAFYSSDVSVADRKRCYESLMDGLPAVESVDWEGRQLMYGYTLINSLLPGADRLKYKGVSSLFDLRIRGGKTEYRLYDRALRNRHSGDAPFALEPFTKGISIYSIVGDSLMEQSTEAYPPVSEFSDARPNRYQNPKLPFGGANIPEVGLRFKLGQPSAEAPDEARVKVVIDWDQ
ncbi:metal-dependent protease [gamma proteobacterium HTCC2207]|uniref:Metal-dependent protease n=1 Tax=gamma proteobacterium HTCC2207 TaxID=314287 RepID=Q1YQR0_9GAMM|nr:metal-dependent protease [gamma proteobacterium HTCC2207]